MNITPAIAWTLLALTLAALEIALPVFVFASLAVAALASALAAWLGAGIEGQVLVFVVTAVNVLLIARRRGRRWLAQSSPLPTNVGALPGTRGIVAVLIDNTREEGRVLLQGMEWSARSARGTLIPPDTAVRVIRVDGVKLIVEPDATHETGD